MIVAQILPLIEGQVSDSRHQIWKMMPHLIFFWLPIFKFLGELGFRATMKCHWDCLPK
jgi:hypothetical protein